MSLPAVTDYVSIEDLGGSHTDEEIRVKATCFADGAEFLRCRFVIDDDRNLVVGHARFKECVLEAKRPLKRISWCPATFEHCVFLGIFAENDFGSDVELYGEPEGALRDCDFSNASLRSCRVLNVHPGDTTFPPWPHFTLLNPYKNAAALRTAEWPSTLRVWVESVTSIAESRTYAIVDHVDRLVKKGGEADSIRRILTGLGKSVAVT